MFGTALPPLPALTSLTSCVATNAHLACAQLTVCGSGARTFGVTDASYGDPSLVLRAKREGTSHTKAHTPAKHRPPSGSIMAGWESCRHSARHRLGLQLAKAGHVKRLEIDTYMHCLNSFRFMAVFGFNGA